VYAQLEVPGLALPSVCIVDLTMASARVWLDDRVKCHTSDICIAYCRVARAQVVKASRVLVVGAGGIGCELLKTLVLTGFKRLHVIDLDTIDVSNLNRQFLFRKHHVGQGKASIAADAVRRFRPDVDITAEMSNVMLPQYDVKFYKTFDLVLNGLDNLEARRHVNKMCVMAHVPLVESGTAAFLGQVTVHVGGRVECFDCLPKPTQKTYAVCTIRRTPEKPIHCIVWSKEVCFGGVFGDGDLADIGEGLAFDRGADTPEGYARKVFNQLFHENINQLLLDSAASEEDLWKGRDPPRPLDVNAFDDDINTGLSDSWKAPDQQDVLDEHMSAQMLAHAVKRLVSERADAIGSLVFDKDDEPVMRFVAAASNLRSYCYGIPMQSYFQAKGMAGNIIHAIATTNAIVSGLIVVQALKLLCVSGKIKGKETANVHCTNEEAREDVAAYCHASFIQQYPSNKKLITPVQCMRPNPDCLVCGNRPLILEVNTRKTKLEHIVSGVLKGEWSLENLTLSNGKQFLYEESEYLDEDERRDNAKFLEMILSELPGGGIENGTDMTVTDDDSNLKVPVFVVDDPEMEAGAFRVEGTLERAKEIAAREERRHAAEKKRMAEPIDIGLDEGDEASNSDRAKKKAKVEDDGVILLD
jgi:ubiquitin-like 1-activating enzyme E1 B